MSNLSVIILTLNEEETIARAINSVKDISDDIVVLDSGSRDGTVKIAKQLGAHVYEHTFKNFAEQRNYANHKAKHDWVLSMDSDEEIPKSLQSEITAVLVNPINHAYLIPRRNIIFGKEIKHTRWSPDAHVWLYDKKKGKWEGTIHEEFRSTGSIGKLQHGKIHHSHRSVKDFLHMLNNYTDMEADLLVSAGAHSGIVQMIYYPVRSFIGRFIYKQGYLDGYHGFVLSILMSLYRFTTWAKVWEKEHHD